MCDAEKLIVDHMPVKKPVLLDSRLCLDNVAPLRHVQTVQELSDILVADLADLLDIGGALGDILEALQILLVLLWDDAAMVVIRFR